MIFILKIESITKMIHKSWDRVFKKYNFEFDDDEDIYPPREHIFRVFEMDIKEIRTILLGQDVYHSEGQAMGLSFSVPDGVKIPPSLQNIFKEIKRNFPDRNYNFKSGNLEKWFYTQKIFLLNCALTVIPGHPGSHMKEWKEFTNDVIKYVCKHNKHCVFVLLGNFAKSKSDLINDKSRIIEGTHPSPLAAGASEPFFGSGIFQKIEEKLGYTIDWQN